MTGTRLAALVSGSSKEAPRRPTLVAFAVATAIGLHAGIASAEAPARDGYRHDGFYLRLATGPTFHRTRIETNRAADAAIVAGGAGLAGGIMLGGSPIPGLAVGGVVFGDVAPDPKVEVGDQTLSGDFETSTGSIGVFVDVFVDPEAGYHFGGSLGVIAHTFDDAKNPTDQEQTHEGFGGALWLGYDAWIAREWSLGGMLRVSGGKHDVERNGVGVTETATATAVSILFTALHH